VCASRWCVLLFYSSVILSLIIPILLATSARLSGKHIRWISFLSLLHDNQIRLVNWPATVPAPGLGFNPSTANPDVLANLASLIKEKTLKIVKWTTGTSHQPSIVYLLHILTIFFR
jgi:hypothetical protein